MAAATEGDDYLAAFEALRAASDAFQGVVRRALRDEPVDAARAADDAEALRALHERWLEASLHLLRRPSPGEAAPGGALRPPAPEARPGAP